MAAATRKLGGYELWTKTLGSPRYILAPMVDQSELAWRLLGRRHGAQLCYSPMFHASVFTRDARYREEALQTCADDHPLIIQFCANDPKTFVEAGKMVEHCCEAVDLNLGCPQAIAKRGHYGSFLQDEWDLIHSIVSAAHKELSVPVCVKLRVFPEIEKTVKYARMLEKAGAQLLVVHGRAREQRGPLTGIASWKHIAAVKKAVRVPVVANGNVQFTADVERCLAETGADAVMSAEGCLHNPALFRGGHPPNWGVGEEYLRLAARHPCPTSYVRGHLFKLCHHTLQRYKELRDRMAQAKTVKDFGPIIEAIKIQCLKDEEKYKTDKTGMVTEFNLPHWVCQPYVRPHIPEKCCAPAAAAAAAARAAASEPSKRIMDEVIVDGVALSRKKLKRLRRNPRLDFSVEKVPRQEVCAGCTNTKGLKCEFNLCKICCRAKRLRDSVECQGHRSSRSNRKANGAQSVTPGGDGGPAASPPDAPAERADGESEPTAMADQDGGTAGGEGDEERGGADNQIISADDRMSGGRDISADNTVESRQDSLADSKVEHDREISADDRTSGGRESATDNVIVGVREQAAGNAASDERGSPADSREGGGAESMSARGGVKEEVEESPEVSPDV